MREAFISAIIIKIQRKHHSKSIGRMVESHAPSVQNIPAFICHLICRILLPGDMLINRSASWSEPTWATQWVSKTHTATRNSVIANLIQWIIISFYSDYLNDNGWPKIDSLGEQDHLLTGCRGKVIGVNHFHNSFVHYTESGSWQEIALSMTLGFTDCWAKK